MNTKPMFLHNLRLASRYWLSPLAGYTNMPFRLAVRELGGLGLATTDLVSARALVRHNEKTHMLIEKCAEDVPLAVQIYGSDAGEMATASAWLENYGAHVIDINMGCPVPKITKGGGGSAMMCAAPAETIELIRRVVNAVRIPVTVKMRLGWDASQLTAPYFARAFEDVGVAAVIIHGRTREQGFSGSVDRTGIRRVVEAVERIPVIGNGDIRTPLDAERMFDETGCAGISMGRGALLNPWIFLQLCRLETTGDAGLPGDYDRRLDFMTRHYELLVAQRGERFGSVTFRKVAGWYSKVLKPGRELHQQMMLLAHVEDFHAIVEVLRRRGEPQHWNGGHVEIAVPQGPISHW